MGREPKISDQYSKEDLTSVLGENLLVGDRWGLRLLLLLPFMLSWKFKSQVFGELYYDFSSSDICTRIALASPSPHSPPLEGFDTQNNRPRRTLTVLHFWGAQQTKPQSFGICDISIVGRGNGKFVSLESVLEGTYGIGFSSPLTSWWEVLRH